jgi:CDP-diacylglycerol--serine O-phosphatidyltransferase
MFRKSRQKRARLRAERVGGGHMNRLIPNAITVGALCAGLSGVRFAIDGRFEMAVGAIVVAAILDGLDGRMARLLNGTSKFGAELDSLSDFISFGVAPALIVYLWVLNAWGGVGWIIALAYAVCCALRLARFNAALSDTNQPSWAGQFFTGVPAPAAAGLALLPMMIHFEAGPGYSDRAIVGAATLALVAFLMVSRLPTFSGKKLHVPRGWLVPALVGVALIFAALASAPWTTLIVAGIVYLASIPVAVTRQQNLRNADAAAAPPPGGKPVLSVVNERGGDRA